MIIYIGPHKRLRSILVRVCRSRFMCPMTTNDSRMRTKVPSHRRDGPSRARARGCNAAACTWSVVCRLSTVINRVASASRRCYEKRLFGFSNKESLRSSPVKTDLTSEWLICEVNNISRDMKESNDIYSKKKS